MDSNELARLLLLEQEIRNLRGVKSGVVDANKSNSNCEITFLSPCYNESENLSELHQRISETCRKYKISNYEILWINNGSTDHSYELMASLKQSDARLSIIDLSRNFGYQGAIACGMLYARGNWVATLDGDLQDPPELIPEMLALAKSGVYDAVYGVRTKRQEHLLKRISYRMFYRLWSITADIKVPLDAGDFGVVNRKIIDAINYMPERQRFIRGLRAWTGFRQIGFPYERDKRSMGASKFKINHMFNLALDGIISYSTLPLRITMFTGFGIISLMLLLSVIQATLRIVAYIGGVENIGVLPPGLTQINMFIVVFFGLTFMFLGIIGEYVGRIYNEVKDRPLFIVRRVL